MSDKIKSHHLARKAILYVRQSSPHQVLHNEESRRLRLELRAVSAFWPSPEKFFWRPDFRSSPSADCVVSHDYPRPCQIGSRNGASF